MIIFKKYVIAKLLGLIILPLLVTVANAQVSNQAIYDLKKELVSPNILTGSIHAKVHEVIYVPTDLIPQTQPNTERWGDVPGTRDYDWAISMDNISYSFKRSNEKIERDVLTNNQISRVFTYTNRRGGQADFGHRIGSIALPDEFGYKLEGNWLGDALDNWKWTSMRDAVDPRFGTVLILEGEITNTDSTHSQTNKVKLTLSKKNHYLIIKKEIQYNVSGSSSDAALMVSIVNKIVTIKGIPLPVDMISETHENLKPISRVVQSRRLTVSNIDLSTLPAKYFLPAYKEGMYVKDSDSNIIYRVRGGKLVIDPASNKKFLSESKFGIGFIICFIAAGLLIIVLRFRFKWLEKK
jgi:hypothetical protein